MKLKHLLKMQKERLKNKESIELAECVNELGVGVL